MVTTTSAVEKGAPIKVRFGRFEVDEAEARLLDDGAPVRLAPKPFAVLCALARTPHALVTKSALLDRVWGHRYVSESVLKTTISDVRAVLDDDPRQPRYIETVSCRGYRFIGAHAQAGEPEALTEPAPNAPTAMATPRMAIGRTRELDRLRTAWCAATAGNRQVAWVAGEAGVGKTALIERFMHEVKDAGWARGHCVANAEPRLPVLEALVGLCQREPRFTQLMREVAPTWLSQLPWLCTTSEREALRRELAEAGEARMLREMGELLDRYSLQRPLLLVIEDLQWADDATVQLMDYIARRRSPARLMWLASFRLTEVIARERPLGSVRQELRLHGLGQEIVLDAFSRAEVAEYVAACMPAAAGDPAFLESLLELTDGLPMLVADAVDRLVARCASKDTTAASMQQRLATIVLPDTLERIVERYIEELTPEQRALLEAASVCGMRFGLSTLAAVLQADFAVVETACAELVRRQRWLSDAPAGEPGVSSDGTYAFRQALHRQVLYKRLAPLARVELHRRLEA